MLAVLLVFIALPWLAAETGFYFPGDFFMGEEVPRVRDPGLAAVHLGFHHGNGGVVLALIALLLSRVPAGRALRAYLSLQLVYGLANAFQDAWNEQLWKRDWVEVARAGRPAARSSRSAGLCIVVAAGAVYWLWFRPSRQE